MSPFSWQGQNLCGLSLAFIRDRRVVGLIFENLENWKSDFPKIWKSLPVEMNALSGLLCLMTPSSIVLPTQPVKPCHQPSETISAKATPASTADMTPRSRLNENSAAFKEKLAKFEKGNSRVPIIRHGYVYSTQPFLIETLQLDLKNTHFTRTFFTGLHS